MLLFNWSDPHMPSLESVYLHYDQKTSAAYYDVKVKFIIINNKSMDCYCSSRLEKFLPFHS